MKEKSIPSLTAGVFLASYSLVTGLYPQGLPAPESTPSMARLATAVREANAALAVAAPGPESKAVLLPAAAGASVKAAVSETREARALPPLVAVDRRIAERTDQLRPNVKKRLAHVARKLPEGVTLLVTSAYRTYEEQASLQSTFGVKAAPGSSTHEHGRGIDLNVLVDGERVPPAEQQQVIGEVMAEAGFRHLGPADPVHYSIPEWELGPDPKEELSLEIPTLAEAGE